MTRYRALLAAVCGCAVVGSPAPARADSPLSWSGATNVDGSHYLHAASCPSASMCVAVDGPRDAMDAAGDVVTSTNPSGGAAAWTVAHVDTGSNNIFGISCPSVSLCVAVDSAGNVLASANPTGGAVEWTSTNVDGTNVLRGISCPSTSLCVAVGSTGHLLTSTDPAGVTAWSQPMQVDGNNTLRGVSCPSSSLCAAVDGAGNVVTSTDPTGGAGKWTVANVDGTHVLRGVSCPSTSLCVAVDDTGNVLTSTDPTDGTSWTPSNVDASNVLFAVSCASSSLCVAVDVPGHVVTTTNPTGGPAAWTVTTVAGAARFYGVSCPSSSLCVAVDSGGNVATGTARPPSESIQQADGDPFVASSTPAGPAAGVSPTARQAVTGVLIDRRWRLGSLPASYSRLAPSGTTIRFTLAVPGTAKLEFRQFKPGRRSGRTCVAENRRNRRGRRCTRLVTVGSLTFPAHAGLNKVRFQGRLSRRKVLKPGDYTLQVTATDRAGHRSAPKTARFTLLPAR